MRDHDKSKLEAPEKEIFDAVTPKLRTLTYGSPEYHASLEEMGPALDHHYSVNAHHPEWGERGMEWREVVGYEGHYEVSSLGDVRSVTRTVSRSGSRGDLEVKGRILTATVTPKGYRRIQLARDGEKANWMVHRLVALAFVSNPDGKPEVNHKDGDKGNNRAGNLEWVTPGENQQHAYDTGLKESSVKYVVHCQELDVTAFGTQGMERALRALGREDVTAAGIWGAMDRGGKHCGLTFEGTLLAEWRRSRLDAMTIIDLIEMLADWKAATLRHEDGDLKRSIDINADRFGYGEAIHTLLLTTARDLGWLE